MDRLFPPKGDKVVPGNRTERVLGPTRDMLEHRETPSGWDLRFFSRFVLRAVFAFPHFTGTVLQTYVFCSRTKRSLKGFFLYVKGGWKDTGPIGSPSLLSGYSPLVHPDYEIHQGSPPTIPFVYFL